MRIEWDRDLTEAQGPKTLPGTYIIEMNDEEKRSLLIGGIVEGGDDMEADLAMQEALITKGMEMKNLKTWRLVRWEVESSRRVGRKEMGKPRLMIVRFQDRRQADYVYHRRKVGARQEIWISRFRPRQMRETEKMLQGMRRRRWMLRKKGEGWKAEERREERDESGYYNNNNQQLQQQQQQQLHQKKYS